MTGNEIEEVRQIARNLARNCGYLVFPCGLDKKPTWPKRFGGSGYKDATTDPARIDWLWHHWPGPLVAIRTGETSGIDAFDVDLKHDTARAWWRVHEKRLPSTRSYRTLGGGAHLYFRHHPGLRCSEGKIAGRDCPGTDCRAEGGYIIFWYAHGLKCLDQSPITDWPAWLVEDLQKLKINLRSPAPARTIHTTDSTKAIDGLINAVATAPEGKRNAILYWAGKRLAEQGISPAEAEAMLLPAALAAGLDAPSARATIHSAYGGGG